MIRQLSEISPIITSHAVGLKKVLLSNAEAESGLTQIAVTELKAGEIAKAHVHEDMEEAFFVLEGELEARINNEISTCKHGCFIFVHKGTSHEIKAITDVRFMTIGCEIRD